jgi:DNA-binding NarL/FixJ family response regulator
MGGEVPRVLLVEDHRAFSGALAFSLDREPDLRVVGRTASAAECRRYLSGGEGFDVAVVDLYLDDGEGIGLIGEMRESCPGVPVVVLTVSVDPADHARAREAGADEVLSKAADLDEIVATVRRFGGG